MTRIADPLPPYCCSCYQHEHVRHVDFEASYDGPVIPGSPINQPVDDLILCENCLAEAFSLLDPKGLHKAIELLNDEVARLKDTIDSKDKAINDLRHTVDELVKHPVRGQQHRPRLEGLPDELKREILDHAKPKSNRKKDPKRQEAGRKARATEQRRREEREAQEAAK